MQLVEKTPLTNLEKPYRFVILGASIAIMFAIWGLGNHPLSLYAVPLTEAYGFKRTAFSVIFSIINLLIAAGSIVFGPLERRWGLKKLMWLGTSFTVCAYLLFYKGSNLIFLYLGAALFGLGIAFTTNNPISALISQWFTKNRGLAIGIVFASSGVGGMVCDILVGRFIARVGFQASLGISGIVIAVVLLVAMFFIRTKTIKEMDIHQKQNTIAPKTKAGMAFKEARKTTSFWLVLATETLWGFSIIPIMANLPAYLSDRGFDGLYISGVVMALVFAVSAIAKIGVGVVNDRYGLRTMVVLLGLAGTGGAIALALVQGNASALLGAVLIGIAFSCLAVPVPLIAAQLFGGKDFETHMGVFSATLTLAGAIATPVSNLIFDQMGSYRPVFVVQAVFFALSIVTGSFAVTLRPAWDEVKDK